MSKEIILTNEILKTFRKYCWKRLDNQCWPWTGFKNEGGYGTLRRGNIYFAHRVSYVIHKGVFNWSLLVLHDCDNPPCCNPAHLFLGTYQDNAKDSVSKGRWVNNKGSNHGLAKLTEEEIIKIRFKAALGIYHWEIAKEFDISRQNVDDIVNYKTWKHVK